MKKKKVKLRFKGLVFLLFLTGGIFVWLLGPVAKGIIFGEEAIFEKITKTEEVNPYIYQWLGPNFKIFWGDKKHKDKQLLRVEKANDYYFQLAFVEDKEIERLKEATGSGGLESKQITKLQGATATPKVLPTPTITLEKTKKEEGELQEQKTTPTPYEEAGTFLTGELRAFEESEYSRGAILGEIKKELEEIKEKTASISADVSKLEEESESLAEEVSGIAGETSLVIKDGVEMVSNAEFARGADFLSEPDYFGVRNRIIIKRKSAPSYYIFRLLGNNLGYEYLDNGNIVFKDRQDLRGNFVVVSPLLSDSEGKVSDDGVVRIYEGNNESKYLAVILDENFLKDKSSVYPLTAEVAITYVQEEEVKIPEKGFVRTEATSPYGYSYIGENYRVDFMDKLTNEYDFKFEYTKKSIRMKLAGTSQNIETELSKLNTEKGAKEGLRLIEVLPYIDMAYFGKNDGIKEMIVLKDKLAQNEFEFEMEVDSDLLIRNDQGRIVFYKERENVLEGALIKTKDYFYFDKPFMADNNGERSEKVKFKIEEREGVKLLKVIADKNWLLEATRSYPVMIDPSITTVGTNYSTYGSFQRHVWYDGTRYWTSFADENGIKFYYTTNIDAAIPTWTLNSSATISTTKWGDTSYQDTSQETTSSRDLLSDTTWTCQVFTPDNTGAVDKAAIETSNADEGWGRAMIANTSPTPTPLTEKPRFDRFASTISSNYAWNDFDFREEPVLSQGVSYNLCVKRFTSQNAYWSKNASGDYTYKIYLRPLETNWSIWADSTNAFVTYYDNMDVKGAKAASYPGTGFSWGTTITTLNGGVCGIKDQSAVGGTCTGADEGDNTVYDFSYLTKDSSDYMWTMAKHNLFTSTSNVDAYIDYKGLSDAAVFDTVYGNNNEDWALVYPLKNGVLDKVDLYLRNSCGAAHTATAKISVDDCTTTTNRLSDEITSASIAGTWEGWVTFDFSSEPLLKKANAYRICMKSDVDYCVRFKMDNSGGQPTANPAWNVYKLYLRSSNSEIVGIKETDTTLKVPNLGDTISTPSALVASEIVYPNIMPLTIQDMYAVWTRNGTLEGSVWDNSDSQWEDSSGTANSGGSNVDSVGTGSTAIGQNFSLIKDNGGDLHIGYISNTGTVIYKKGTVNSTPGVSWGTAKTLDSGTTNYYVSATHQMGNNTAYFFWRPSSTTIRYNKVTLNTNAWDSSNTDWLTGLVDVKYLGTDLTTAYRILMLRQQGASPTPYQIYQDSLDTGLDKLMRGGKWFEEDEKQRYSF